MKYFKILLLGLSVIIILYGCYYDNEEQLYPVSPDKNCDTANITYSGHIAKTLSMYCYSCHGSSYKQTGNGIQLNKYSSVIKYYDRIIGAITHDSQYSEMPKGASKLGDCNINQFVIWKNEGSPNN